MVCIVENIFQDGEWAILEWRDPLGLRGCGFFHVVRGKIVLQRGYWDKLSFLRLQGLPMPTDPLSPSCEPADRPVMIVELAGLIRDPSNDPVQPLRSPTL